MDGMKNVVNPSPAVEISPLSTLGDIAFLIAAAGAVPGRGFNVRQLHGGKRPLGNRKTAGALQNRDEHFVGGGAIERDTTIRKMLCFFVPSGADTPAERLRQILEILHASANVRQSYWHSLC